MCACARVCVCVCARARQARPELTGEGTKQISLIGPPFRHAATDETTLGGIPGDAPANILTGY